MPAPTTLPFSATPIDAAVAAANLVLGTPRAMFIPWANGVKAIWKNPAGKTAQQVIDQFGIKAASIMAASAQIVALFNTYGDDALKADVANVVALVKPFTVNDDGTVTVTVTS